MPVPLHPRRERERGYNQAELLARELKKRTGLPLESRAIRRLRNTPPQVSVSGYDARARAVRDPFECEVDVGGQRVLLIDDVVTRGSTISACAAALKADSARSV